MESLIPLWPLVWILDHRAVNVEPDIDIESSERCVEDIDPEILAKRARGGWDHCILDYPRWAAYSNEARIGCCVGFQF